MSAATPAPPPLDTGLEQLLRRMRLPHMRRIAPEVSLLRRRSGGTRPGLYRLVDAAYTSPRRRAIVS